MYRGRLWTRRQQSGFGSPEESNELPQVPAQARPRLGINIDSDIAGKLGLDPDYPLAQGDVGLQGTSMATCEDMAALFKDIPLDRISSNTHLPTPSSVVMMGQYLMMARAIRYSMGKPHRNDDELPFHSARRPPLSRQTRTFSPSIWPSKSVSILSNTLSRAAPSGTSST